MRLTVRVDIEDRNFHTETKRNGGADHHFSTNTRPLDGQDRLRVHPGGGPAFARVRQRRRLIIRNPNGAKTSRIPSSKAAARSAAATPTAPAGLICPCRAARLSRWSFAPTHTDPVRGRNSERPEFAPDVAKPANGQCLRKTMPLARQLLRAARAFVVRRDDGVTVIAGYPWFLDWGRDSLICARGLLAAGMARAGETIARRPSAGLKRTARCRTPFTATDASNRDTSDAPLWYGIVCEETAALVGARILSNHGEQRDRTIAGRAAQTSRAVTSAARPTASAWTRASGLIWSPSHFTWMDTNHPAGTPREGYPVEIQVLWIRLLRQLQRIGRPAERKRWEELADAGGSFVAKIFLARRARLSGRPAHRRSRASRRRKRWWTMRCAAIACSPSASGCSPATRRGVAWPPRCVIWSCRGRCGRWRRCRFRRRCRFTGTRASLLNNPAGTLLGPLRRRRGHAPQTGVSQRHGVDVDVPDFLRGAGARVGLLAGSRRRRARVSRQHGPPDDGRLPRPDPRNPRWRRAAHASAVATRRPGARPRRCACGNFCRIRGKPGSNNSNQFETHTRNVLIPPCSSSDGSGAGGFWKKARFATSSRFASIRKGLLKIVGRAADRAW